jgi:hypothetical protein
MDPGVRRDDTDMWSKKMVSAYRVGRAQRYPSIAFRGADGFRKAQPILPIDDKTGSSDLPVGRLVDRRVESYF